MNNARGMWRVAVSVAVSAVLAVGSVPAQALASVGDATAEGAQELAVAALEAMSEAADDDATDAADDATDAEDDAADDATDADDDATEDDDDATEDDATEDDAADDDADATEDDATEDDADDSEELARAELDALAAANADVLADGQYAISAASKTSMGLSGDGSTVSLQLLMDDEAQIWTVSHDEQGYITLTNDGTGKVLDVTSACTDKRTKVQLWRSNSTYAQKWIAVKDADGRIELISALQIDRALDLPSGSTSAGTVPQIYTDNDTVAQRWIFQDISEVYLALDDMAAEYADTLADGTYVVLNNKAGRGVLDVASGSTSKKANVQLYESNGTEAQQWVVSHDEKGYVTFTCVKSGMVLDVSGGTAVRKTNVWQYTANDTLAQKWIVVPDALGGYTIYSALWPNLVLDLANGSTSSGTNLWIYDVNDTAAQSFTFVDLDAVEGAEPGEEVVEEDVWYTIGASCASGKVVDMVSGGLSSGVNAQIYTNTGALAQLFTFVYTGDGYYQIMNASSGKVLADKNGDVVPGANVLQVTANEDSDIQLWAAHKNSDGSYSFYNKATGLALAVEGGASANGTNVCATTPDSTKSQKFMLSVVKNLIRERIYTFKASYSTGYVVDVTSGGVGNGVNIQLWSSNSTNAQKWSIERVSGKTNTYTIESVLSGKVLADSSNNVVQQVADGGTDQQWTASISARGVTFTNVKTGKVIAVSGAEYAKGTNIKTVSGSGAWSQSFRLVGASPSAPLSNGSYYYLCVASSTSKVVETADKSFQLKANVQLYSKDSDDDGQVWKAVKYSDGTYSFINANSGLALEVKDASTSSGTNVQQNTYHSDWKRQRWKVTYEGGGWQITSVLSSSVVLDVKDSSTSNGTNVRIATDKDSTGQRFVFSPTTYDGISGDDTLDDYLRSIYRSEGENLKDLFYHVVNDYRYIRTYDGYSGSWTVWSISYAKQMVQNKGGNCYRHAALFCWLAIGLGYDAKVAVGYVPSRSQGWAPHGWVEIKISGTTYIYDPDLAKDYPTLNWYKRTYSNAPVTYKKTA